MSYIKTTANSRINIPITATTRAQLEQVATGKGVSLAELGRQAIEAFLAEERRHQRLQALCSTATKYADIIEEVDREWRHTEVEGWTDD